MEPLVVVAAGLVLLRAWTSATRSHAQRRDAARAEWEAGAPRPDLWTSSARCAACGQPGGLLEAEGDGVVYVCLTCGERRGRRTLG